MGAYSRSAVYVLLVVAAFFLSHPYTGIRHDGTLYLGQALVELDPARMADDPFFVFGSQASFSVVPRAYADVIHWLGVGDGTRLLMFASLTLYLVAAWWLVTALVPAPLVAIALVCVAVLSPVYGGHRLIGYAETFFTARSLAEPVILAGLGLLIRRRTWIGLSAVGAALLIHPLMTIPAVLFAWIWLVLSDRRWSWCAVLGLIPLGLALAGIAPFSDFFRTYDADWLSVVKDANPFVFTFNWSFGDWSEIAADVVVAAATASLFRTELPVLSRFAAAAIVVCVFGIAATVVAVDLSSNVLFTGLQLWRCDWILHWTATIALAPLVYRLWSLGTNRHRASALLFVATMISAGTFAPIVLVALASALLYWKKSIAVSAVTVNALYFLCFGLLFQQAIRQAAAITAFFQLLGGSLAVQVSRPLSITLILVVVVALGMRYLPRYRVVGAVMAGCLVAVAIAAWDQRDDWIRYQEDYAESHGLLWADIVKPEDRVYWFREVRAPWLMMRHANYYSPNQSAGVLFNRKTAIELDARAKTTAILAFQETVCRLMNTLNKQESACEPDLQAVNDLCVDADRLSYVVLESSLSIPPAGSVRTGLIMNGLEKTFYLYRCSDVMRGVGRAPTAVVK